MPNPWKPPKELKRDPPNRFVFDPKRAFEKDPKLERPERDPAKDELPKVDPPKFEAPNPEGCLAPKDAPNEALLDGLKECQAPSGLPPL